MIMSYLIISRIRDKRDEIDSKHVTAFLIGVAFSLVLVASFAVSGVLGDQIFDGSNSIDELPPREVGERTVEMLNSRVLHNTPNNVTGSLVKVESADSETLAQFYEVILEVENPTTQQQTTVYVKKDASLVFLNHPRYFDPQEYRNQQHQ